MGRHKNATSQMDVGEKAKTPLAMRLSEIITNPVELSAQLGVSTAAISQYRNGGAQPTLDRLCKIADIYGVSVDYLLGRSPDPSPDPDHVTASNFTGLSPAAVDWLHKRKDTDDKFMVGLINALFEGKDSDLAFMLFFAMYDYATSQFSSVVIKDDVMKSDRKVDTDEARALLKYYAQETFSLVLDRLYSRYTALSIAVAKATIKVKEYNIAKMEGDNHDGQQ